MGLIRKAMCSIGSVLVANLALTAINIVQAGSRFPDGRSLKEIIGKNPDEAGFDDIEILSRSEKMQLFYAASCPSFTSLHGEYKARVLSGGVLGPASELFTHHVFPTGGITLKTRWEGKAFIPETEKSGYGYNLFSDMAQKGRTLRIRKFRTSIAPTTIGKGPGDSIHLIYNDFNSGTVRSMHDEVRKINERLFICAGYMALGGGAINPAPFVLFGEPSDCIGLDYK